MADNGEIKIPIFYGEDYAMWKKRLTMSLKLKKCAVNIERAKTDKEGEEWDAKEVKAISLIYNSISNKQMEFINDEETAYDMIKKFDSLYLKESTALQIVYRNKLEKIKLKNYNDASTFFSDFEKCVNDLKSAGAKITERKKLNYILNTLPGSYSYIGDLFDVLKEEEQTAEYVKSKILMKEIKMQKEENYKPSQMHSCPIEESASNVEKLVIFSEIVKMATKMQAAVQHGHLREAEARIEDVATVEEAEAKEECARTKPSKKENKKKTTELGLRELTVIQRKNVSLIIIIMYAKLIGYAIVVVRTILLTMIHILKILKF